MLSSHPRFTLTSVLYPLVRPSGYPSVRISIPTDIHPYGYSSVRISVRTDIRPYGYPSVRISVRTDIRPYGYPSVRISVRPSVRISVRPSIRPYPRFTLTLPETSGLNFVTASFAALLKLAIFDSSKDLQTEQTLMSGRLHLRWNECPHPRKIRHN